MRCLRRRERYSGIEHSAKRSAGQQLNHHKRLALITPVVYRHDVGVVELSR